MQETYSQIELNAQAAYERFRARGDAPTDTDYGCGEACSSVGRALLSVDATGSSPVTLGGTSLPRTRQFTAYPFKQVEPRCLEIVT